MSCALKGVRKYSIHNFLLLYNCKKIVNSVGFSGERATGVIGREWNLERIPLQVASAATHSWGFGVCLV